MSSVKKLSQEFNHKKILIWGFGKEGKSSYHFIRNHCPDAKIYIADDNESTLDGYFKANGDQDVSIYNFDSSISPDTFDIILKAPGISCKDISFSRTSISCQTDLFLKLFRDQTIGITGSKGKSTVASLTHHLLQSSKFHALLGGNIGIPVFDLVDQIQDDSLIVLELSAHQLQFCKHSPRISILLNLFEEHLDHFISFEEYSISKLNIARFQAPGDLFFCNQDIEYLSYIPQGELPMGHLIQSGLDSIPKSSLFMEDARLKLKFGPIEYKLCGFTDYVTLAGRHNLFNSMVATAVSLVCGADPISIRKGFYSYETLEHRLQFIGIFGGMKCYNDSIATIPEACIEALKTLGKVDILLLGGHDRGINYNKLSEFLKQNSPRIIICMREAGKRIYEQLNHKLAEGIICEHVDSLESAFNLIAQYKKKEDICLLSPAAASYGEFENFEERGKAFLRKVKELS